MYTFTIYKQMASHGFETVLDFYRGDQHVATFLPDGLYYRYLAASLIGPFAVGEANVMGAMEFYNMSPYAINHAAKYDEATARRLLQVAADKYGCEVFFHQEA